MTLGQLQNPLPIFPDAKGLPITGGRVYIGVNGLDPEANPAPVWWDAAGTVGAAQPLSMKGGFIVNSGNVVPLYTPLTFSIRVYDALGNVVFYNPTVTIFDTQYGSAINYETWASLNAVTGSVGQSALIFTDAGTHTDPVVGGTVSNSGLFFWSSSPAGWKRVGDTTAADAASAATTASAAAVSASADADSTADDRAAIETAIADFGAGTALNVPVANRTLLALLATTHPAYLFEAGREGMFVWSSADHSTHVTADTRQGIYVAPSSDTTGTSGAWVRQWDGPVQLKWFHNPGRIPFVTDDTPAMECAKAVIRARKTGVYTGIDEIHLGRDKIYLSAPFDLNGLIVSGVTSAQPYGASTLVRFAANINGFILSDTDGAHSQLRDMQIWGGNVSVDGSGNVTTFANGTSTTGHGVVLKANWATAINVMCAFFGGDGFHGNSFEGGMCNTVYVERCQSIYNSHYGFWIQGSDGNAGNFIGNSAISNGGAGFVDFSFLGNTHVGAHARDNGSVNPVITNGPVGTCTYGGHSYYVVANKLTEASTTVPGTDATVWKLDDSVGAATAWVTGRTWLIPGSYVTNVDNVNATTTFVGCYAELAQARVQSGGQTMFIGCTILAWGPPDIMQGTVNQAQVSNGPGAASQRHIAYDPSDTYDGQTWIGGNNAKNILSHHISGKVFDWQRDDNLLGFGKVGTRFTLDNAFDLFITVNDTGFPYQYGAFAIGRAYIGSAGNGAGGANWFAPISALSDLNGKVLRKGDRFWNTNAAAAGDPYEWMCTTAGTYGSGAVVTVMTKVTA